MPDLEDISYSRDETVAAANDYYDFLTKMYLKESDIIKPPAGGWPSVMLHLQCLGKTDEVIALLSRLPYIRWPSDDRDQSQGAPRCIFADWQKIASSVGLGRINGEFLGIASEGASNSAAVPPHVIGLTCGGRGNPVFLLDTKLGITHWHECPGEVIDNPPLEPVQNDPYGYAPEKEAEWRAEGEAWANADFFEVLKEEFRQLHFIPLSSRLVIDTYSTWGPNLDGMVVMLQDIYRAHGWPNLEQYRKRECLEAVQRALEERYPIRADRREDE